MTFGYGSGHGPLEGQWQGPQGQPWLPPQYNPRLHHERMHGMPVLPVPYQQDYGHDPYGQQPAPRVPPGTPSAIPRPRSGGQGAPQPPTAGQWPPQPPSNQPIHQGAPSGGSRSWPRRHPVLTALGGIGALLAFAVATSPANSDTGGTPPAASTPAARQQTHPSVQAHQTVTYVVTGSAADVTYGPAGSDLDGGAPMRMTKPLGNPSYYDISAQLQGGGTVSCAILVDGKAVSTATASGGYNIADCEISQDPLSGQWEDTNAG